MSKKLISLLLTICMLFCLSACGATETSSNVNNTPSESQTDITQDTDENTLGEENSQVSSNTEESKENDTQTQTPVSQSKPASTTNQPTHTHSYSNATCTSPKKCSCGATSGNALGHGYSNANCTTPKKCTRCGMIAGTALGHQFSSATCTSPQICSRCGTTSGNALGHNYTAANCNSPKTCTRCGQTSGGALGHNYVNNKCSRCGKVDPDSLPVALDKLPLIDNSGTLGYTYEYNTGSLTDSFGSSYVSYHYFRADDDGTYAIFNLNNTYSTLSFDIVAPQEMLSDGKVTIEVFVDDILKYSKNNFSKTSGKVHANVNVKNGTKLTIKATRTDGTWIYDANIALVNAQLTK